MNYFISSVIDIFTALLTPVIAILGVYIAIQQYRLAREKQRIEIYDRRLRIYTTAIGLIREVQRNFTISEDAYYKFEEEAAEAEFLFGKEVTALLNDMSDVGFNILLAKSEDGFQEIPIEVNEPNQRHADLINKFLGFEPSIKSIFIPYLNLPITRVKKTKAYTQRIADTIPEVKGEEDKLPF